MSEPDTKYRRYRTARTKNFSRLEGSVKNTDYEVSTPSLENITYNNAKAELKFLSQQIEIIEELYKRKKVLSRRAKELEKFINTLDKLESTEEEVVSALIEQVKVEYNEGKAPLQSKEASISQGRLNDFL